MAKAVGIWTITISAAFVQALRIGWLYLGAKE